MPGNRTYLLGCSHIDSPIIKDGLTLKYYADNVTQFNKYLATKNIPYLYIQAPNKLSPEEKNLPKYINNILNHIASEFLQYLETNSVANFDIRKSFISNGIDFADKFFKTDVHWTPETAFEITPTLCELINIITNIEFDNSFFDINNYNTKTHKRMFQGEYALLSGSVIFSDLSDFTIILPKFDTNFSFECKNINYYREGRAEESLLLESAFSWDMTNPKHVYSTYNLVHGEYTIIKNKLAYNDKKILLLSDSFSNPVASFLSHHFSELHFLEMRNNMNGVQNYHKKDLFNIIETVKPDIVIQMYTPACLTLFPNLFNINPYN